MVRASETYGYPLVKAMQHRKSEAPERVTIGKSVCGWFFRTRPVE